MRGQVDRQQSMFVAFDLEQRIAEDHPLRPIKRWCDGVLAGMSRDFQSGVHAARPGQHSAGDVDQGAAVARIVQHSVRASAV